MKSTHSIMFHHFHSEKHLPAQGSLSAEDFEEMLDWLGDRYNILNASEYLLKFEKACLKPEDICLSFDDALLCQFDVAVPVLKQRGIEGFFFVYSSVFSGNPDPLEIFRYFRTSYFGEIDEFYECFFSAVESKDRALYQSAYETFKGLDYLAAFPFYSDNDRWFRYLRDQFLGVERYNDLMHFMMKQKSFDIKTASSLLWMTEKNLSELQEDGHLIGLHSYSHPTQMSKLTRTEQKEQYGRNMEHLQGVLGKGSIVSMSHPCGDYDAGTLDLLTEMGIRIGFRSSLSVTEVVSALEVPRDDHANVLREMRA